MDLARFRRRLLLAYLNELGDFSRAKLATSSELISGQWNATACQSKLLLDLTLGILIATHLSNNNRLRKSQKNTLRARCIEKVLPEC